MGRLSDSERKATIEKMRAVESQHAQAGVSAGSRIICHNCGHARPLRGAVRYDRYRLCNDCALRYELALAEGEVKTIGDFVLAH